MERQVLIVPIDEIILHLEINERQDIKVVAPSILTDELYKFLTEKGKRLKPEVPLDGNLWAHSKKTQANMLCESADFAFENPEETKGPFAISFANDRAEQEEHYHKHHTEIYFSEHRMSGYYRNVGKKNCENFDIEHGGLVLFQPNIIHYMELSGLTLIIEIPSLDKDKFV